MSLASKLSHWVDAGLISRDQQAQIVAHEQARQANSWKFGVGMAGLLSILLGVALIVASNWQNISDGVKLGTHFALNATLTWLVWRWHLNPARDLHREVALFSLWGLTLTLIALIGQVFQLGGEAYMALRVWFWLTTPMILLFAQSSYTARLWSIALIFYVPYDLIAATFDATQNWSVRLTSILMAGIAVPVLAWCLGSYARFAVNRPTMATTLRKTGLFVALAAVSLSGAAYYGRQFYEYALYVPAIFALAVIALRFALQAQRGWTHGERTQIDILCLAGLFICAPLLAPMHGTILGMLHFMTFWLLAGWLWQNDANGRMVSLAIGFITLRLFIGFLELFGSMMLSGFGFILVGLVLLALVKIARRLDQRLKGHLLKEEAA